MLILDSAARTGIEMEILRKIGGASLAKIENVLRL